MTFVASSLRGMTWFPSSGYRGFEGYSEIRHDCTITHASDHLVEASFASLPRFLPRSVERCAFRLLDAQMRLVVSSVSDEMMFGIESNGTRGLAQNDSSQLSVVAARCASRDIRSFV
jgi:hypothetical protein